MDLLLQAAEEGNLDEVRDLVENQGVDVNTAKNEFGETALHLAAFGDHLDVVQYLATRRRVDVDAKDRNGMTALHLAAAENHLYVVQFLVSIVDDDATNFSGETALDIAQRRGQADVVEFLSCTSS
jgi:ankyrin repeat protein